jgi:hypothetical protein
MNHAHATFAILGINTDEPSRWLAHTLPEWPGVHLAAQPSDGGVLDERVLTMLRAALDHAFTSHRH